MADGGNVRGSNVPAMLWMTSFPPYLPDMAMVPLIRSEEARASLHFHAVSNVFHIETMPFVQARLCRLLWLSYLLNPTCHLHRMHSCTDGNSRKDSKEDLHSADHQTLKSTQVFSRICDPRSHHQDSQPQYIPPLHQCHCDIMLRCNP